MRRRLWLWRKRLWGRWLRLLIRLRIERPALNNLPCDYSDCLRCRYNPLGMDDFPCSCCERSPGENYYRARRRKEARKV